MIWRRMQLLKMVNNDTRCLPFVKKVKEKSQLYIVIPVGICRFTFGLNTALVSFSEPPSRAV